MRWSAVAGFGGDGGDGHVRRFQQEFGACETLTADLFADGVAEVLAEERVEDWSPDAEGAWFDGAFVAAPKVDVVDTTAAGAPPSSGVVEALTKFATFTNEL